jgi:TolA-binding protein
MFRKFTLVSLVLFIFLLFGITGECFANVPVELEQTKSNIISLIQEGNYAQAHVQTQQLIADLANKPGLPKALYEIADKYCSTSVRGPAILWATKYENSKYIYEQIKRNHPESPYAAKAELGLARVNVLSLIVSQNYGQAEEDFDKLLVDFSGHPDLPETIYWTAEKYQWATKYDRAKNLYAQISQSYPDSPWANGARLGISRANILSLIESQQYSRANNSIDKLIVDFSGHTDLPETLYWIARKYGWSERCEEEKGVYLQITRNYPDCTWASKAKLGVARADVMSLIISGNYDQAEAALNKLATDFSKHPDLFDTLYWVAERFKWSGRYEQAQKIYQQLVQNHPDSPYAVRANLDIAKTKVISLAEAKDYDGAEKALDKFITDFSEYPDLPEKVLEVAEPYYNEALRLESEGLISESKDLFKKVLVVCEKVEKRFPNYAESAYMLRLKSICYRALGDYEESVKCCQKIVDDWPSYAYAWSSQFLIGCNYEDLKRTKAIPVSEADTKIRIAYKKLLENYPNSPAEESAQSWLDLHNPDK